MSTTCIFCRIVAGDAPSATVRETEATVAFMDIQPATEGHVLVIPRVHCETVYQMRPEAMASVAVEVQAIAAALRQVLDPAGLTVTQANGAAAGQSVPHYHVHLIPRAEGVRLRMHGTEMADPARLAALAARLREHL